MLSSLLLIRSRSLAKNDVSGNETAAESPAVDQDTSESAAVGEVEEEQQEIEITGESEKESEIVQDVQGEGENEQESGAAPDSVLPDRRPESESQSENIVQDAQNQDTEITEESGEDDAERSENVKEVIKEIVVMNQQETDTQVVQTVSEPEYIISTDDYRVISLLLLSAILGAIIATALLNVINRGF